MTLNTVRQRHVFFLSGFDPKGAAYYHRLYAEGARAQAATQSSRPVDPRSVRGDLAQRSVPRAGSDAVRPKAVQRDPSMAVAQAATRPHSEPVAIYQPVPHIRVDRDSTARLYLTVGDDGNVRDIEVVQSVPGEMPKLIAAVQNWRFRPAMQDVPSRRSP